MHCRHSGSSVISYRTTVLLDIIHAAGMDETCGTYVGDECVAIHDYDGDTSDGGRWNLYTIKVFGQENFFGQVENLLLLGQEEDFLLVQEEDLLLMREEDLLLAQEEDLLLGQEEDLLLLLSKEEYLLLAQSTLAAAESTLVLADRARLARHLPAWPSCPVAWLGVPPGCPVGHRPVAPSYLPLPRK